MDRYKKAQITSILGIMGNIFLLVIKAIAGMITNSQAMISDAFNSAGDIFSSLMSFIGNKISSKEADADHNLGHGKAEYIFSLLISISMMVVILRLFYNSLVSLFYSYDYHFSYFLIIVSLLTIIIKMSLFLYTNHVAKKINSILVKANAKDHISDVVLTSLTLIAALFGMRGITAVDGIVGIVVSIWLFYVAIKIFSESYDVLMDKGMPDELKEKIIDITKKYKEIIKINHFNSTPVGYRYQISLTIFVDGRLSTYESHEIANRLEKEISQLEEIYLAVIHVNPIDVMKND